jgi:hypothetical protein
VNRDRRSGGTSQAGERPRSRSRGLGPPWAGIHGASEGPYAPSVNADLPRAVRRVPLAARFRVLLQRAAADPPAARSCFACGSSPCHAWHGRSPRCDGPLDHRSRLTPVCCSAHPGKRSRCSFAAWPNAPTAAAPRLRPAAIVRAAGTACASAPPCGGIPSLPRRRRTGPE